MSLDKFINKEEIISVNGEVLANKWDTIDSSKIELENIRTGPANIGGVNFDSIRLSPEAHIYVKVEDNKLISSIYDLAYQVIGSEAQVLANGKEKISNTRLALDYSQIVKNSEVPTGDYHIVTNHFANIIGDRTRQHIVVEEISPDRTEIKCRYELSSAELMENLVFNQPGLTVEGTGKPGLTFIIILAIVGPMEGDVALNFGDNKTAYILNQDEWGGSFYFKLLKPLDESIKAEDTCWLVYEAAESVSDDITFQFSDIENLFRLQGPNFDVNADLGTITETDFKAWNDILGNNLSTSQKLIDSIFSSSYADSQVGLDYSGFQKFVHFSSAEERLANFKYKLQLIEFYNANIDTLNGASGTDADTFQSSVSTNEIRRDSIISSFDGFEKWLYSSPTSSNYSHQSFYDSDIDYTKNENSLQGGYIGAQRYEITSYPKFISGSETHVYHTSHSLSQAWYDNLIATASLYDQENPNALNKTIPEHVRTDTNNSQYELFVDMIGHHFDIIYSYTDKLSEMYYPEEHPQLGLQRDQLYEVAQSMGWTLSNGNQAESLWKYKLGTNSSSKIESTGSIFSKSNEEITTEVWRRIVNNLPYMLKSKGTARSIKSLMNTYGIPQTLLSIREYGGPKVEEDVPLLIEDRFSYALQFQSASVDTIDHPYIRFSQRDYTTNIGNWGFQRPGLGSGEDIPHQTVEFRFKPGVKENMLLHTVAKDHLTNGSDIRTYFQLAVEHTGSYSGSDEYGRLVFSHIRGTGNSFPSTGSTDWVPLYDGNFWNVRWFFTATGSGAGIYNRADNINTTYHVQCQQASDYITGKIVHSTSASYTPTIAGHHPGWGSTPTAAGGLQVRSFIGGFPGVGGTNDQFRVNTNLRRFLERDNSIAHANTNTPNVMSFSGSMQEYREWLENIGQEAFDLHTLNPTSYVSGLNATSSFDTLVRHYPLGTDLNAVDHSLDRYKVLSSSHPAQHILDFQLLYHSGSSEELINSGSSFATMSNFPAPLNSERGNYDAVEETYYVQGVSLGATLPKSQKIRFDDNGLLYGLNNEKSGERSKFDFASIDLNKLGLFYAPSDQINKDIFNQIGDVELDDFVGDPSHTHDNHYPDLHRFAEQYWKKYSDRNDLNAYMRIFSQFDFSLFEQIKQMLAERVDDAMGLLIEPNAIERSKVRITKPPVIENPQYEMNPGNLARTASGLYLTYEGGISGSPSLAESDLAYHLGTGGTTDNGNHFADLDGAKNTASADYFVTEKNPYDNLPSATSSMMAVYTRRQHKHELTHLPNNNDNWESGVYNHPGTFTRRLSVRHVSESLKKDAGVYGLLNNTDLANMGFTDYVFQNKETTQIAAQFNTYTQRETINDLHLGVWHYNTNAASSSNVTQSYMYGEIITTVNNDNGEYSASAIPAGFAGSKRVCCVNTGSENTIGDIYVPEIQHTVVQQVRVTADFVDHSASMATLTFENVHIAPRTNVTARFSYVPITANMGINVDQVQLVRDIKEVGEPFLADYIDEQRKSTIFETKTLFYMTGSGDKFQKITTLEYSASTGQPPESSSFSPADYMDDQNLMRDRVKFLGSRISGPGVNMPSPYDALGFAPIIEVFEVNPNLMSYASSAQISKFASPTNIIIRGASSPTIEDTPIAPLNAT